MHSRLRTTEPESAPAALDLLIHAPRAHHDELLRDWISPLAAALEQTPGFLTLHFVRYNKPDWHLRLSALARDPDTLRSVEERLADLLSAIRARGLARDGELAPYTPDAELYGGTVGLRLAERIFHVDTRACLALLQAEARGALARSRREFCLVMTERFLDLLAFDRTQRSAFYQRAYAWAVELGFWQAEEREVLDRRYAALEPGLDELLCGPTRHDPESLWGGPEPARIAERCLADLGALAAEVEHALGGGRIRQEPIRVAWALTHLHANRLQIEAHAEAILRYFMHRFHEARAE